MGGRSFNITSGAFKDTLLYTAHCTLDYKFPPSRTGAAIVRGAKREAAWSCQQVGCVLAPGFYVNCGPRSVALHRGLLRDLQGQPCDSYHGADCGLMGHLHRGKGLNQLYFIIGVTAADLGTDNFST